MCRDAFGVLDSQLVGPVINHHGHDRWSLGIGTSTLTKRQLTPDIVFLVFLPPLLYAAAWQTDLREFIDNLRPISMLAFGLVLVTTVVVAWVTQNGSSGNALGCCIRVRRRSSPHRTRSLPLPSRNGCESPNELWLFWREKVFSMMRLV